MNFEESIGRIIASAYHNEDRAEWIFVMMGFLISSSHQKSEEDIDVITKEVFDSESCWYGFEEDRVGLTKGTPVIWIPFRVWLTPISRYVFKRSRQKCPVFLRIYLSTFEVFLVWEVWSIVWIDRSLPSLGIIYALHLSIFQYVPSVSRFEDMGPVWPCHGPS